MKTGLQGFLRNAMSLLGSALILKNCFLRTPGPAKVKQLVIFHHEPANADRDIEKIHQGTLEYRRSYNQKFNPKDQALFPNDIAIAYDGLVVET